MKLKIGGTIGTLARLALLIMGLAVLTACDSAEERAEAHYQSALALLEAGDVARAVVEFRNVFKLNGLHRDARAAFADLRRGEGNYGEAIGQYLRLVEQYPDDYQGHRALAEMFAETGNWQEMTAQAAELVRIAPEDGIAKALVAIDNYHAAVEARDPLAADEAAKTALAMRDALPDYVMLRQVLIDNAIRKGRFDDALAELDQTLALAPDNVALYTARLSVLAALGDGLAIEAQLKDNISRFPEDTSYALALVRFYMSQRQPDLAEAFLRDRIAEAPDEAGRKLTLLQFLAEIRGNEAALAEIDRIIAEGEDDPDFLQLRSGILFDLGKTETAMADLQALAARLGHSDDARSVLVTLARMRQASGDRAGAAALVEQVLVDDPTHVDALKIRAGWLIDADRTGEAIVTLRTALDQQPDDADIFTLLARAHERDGNTELIGEMLALAVETSHRAPEESVRYGRYLIASERFGPAETMLVDALRLAPTNAPLLHELGYVYLGLREWGRLGQVIATLRNLSDPQAADVANELQTRMLAAQERVDEAVTFLADLVAQGAAGFDADLAIVQAQLERGNAERAKVYIRDRLAENPGDEGLTFLLAATEAALGNVGAAEALYRANVGANPQDVQSWMGLFRLAFDSGAEDQARQIAAAALQAVPDAPALLWIRASLMERDGDIAGAIAIYQRLYDRDSENLIVVNNLASLMVQQAQDPDTVNRAYLIARRLRPSTLPPYRDTYGWLAYLRGDFVEALRALEPAAAGLSDDPVVQYHLAKAYLGTDQTQRAYDQFRQVAAMVNDNDPRAFAADTRDQIDRLGRLPEIVGSD